MAFIRTLTPLFGVGCGGPGRKFTHYGILGDDVIIGDRRVADQYASALELLGVEVSLVTSLSSSSGAFEFAKKCFIKRGSYDCSPVSLVSSCAFDCWPCDHQAYVLKMKSILRIGGAGYKVMSRLSPLTLTGRWKRLIRFLSYDPGFQELTFEWWLSATAVVSLFEGEISLLASSEK